jgi:malate dehydrogenase (quinone)
MLNVLEKVFKDKVATPEWQAKIHQIIPSYGTKLNDSPAAVQQEWNYTAEILQLEKPPVIDQSVGTSTAAPAQPVESKPANDMAL